MSQKCEYNVIDELGNIVEGWSRAQDDEANDKFQAAVVAAHRLGLASAMDIGECFRRHPSTAEKLVAICDFLIEVGQRAES